MRRFITNARPYLVIAAGIVAIVVSTACSQNGGTALTPAAPQSVAPGGGRVAMTYAPRAVVAPPNDAWEIVPGVLTVKFTPAMRASSKESAAGLRVAIPYPPERSAEILASRAAIVSAGYSNGTSLRWPQFGTVDQAHHRLTLQLPNALLDGATNVSVALGVDSGKFIEEPPGPRYWDGKDWQKTGTIKAGKETVVLIHGIFSSVESAFPTGYFVKCPNDIARAGGFDQVLGFDYDWFEPPEKEGALFADFLQKVVAAKVSSLTIEAHSYGSLVTVAAVPKLGADAKVANVVTLGGPLPLRGSPLGEKRNTWRMGMMLGLLDWLLKYPPDVVDKAFDSGMVASLATNSPELQTVLSDYKAMAKKPHFVQAAGTEWICLIPGLRTCLYSEQTFEKILIDGTGVKLPWDGVVETRAAMSTDIPDAVATPFPLSHIELQCKASVIKWVGKQLK